MSNIYIQEPPTSGKVLLQTTVGDIDIELWSKETPKACRNFVQLCLEGYYNGTTFHRVIKGFIVQGGDPNGDGTGGESIYGQPFKDEFHTRLRFVRRGLVAMANAGKDDNTSQFFFTLGATPELQNKNSIFGKVTGNTLYNMLKLEEGLVDKDDRPLYPHKIISTKVLSNPFPDIEPRTTTPAKEIPKSEKPKEKLKKNFKLLSFGEEAEEDEAEMDAVNEVYKGQSKSIHDLTDDPGLSSVPAIDINDFNNKNSDGVALDNIRKKFVKASADKVSSKVEEDIKDQKFDDKIGESQKEKLDERKEIRSEIKKLKKELSKKAETKPDVPEEIVEESESVKEDNEVLAEYHHQLATYDDKIKKIPRKGTSEREAQTLMFLEKFKSKLETAKEAHTDDNSIKSSDEENDDEAWLVHCMRANEEKVVLAKDANMPAADRYDISDPRNPITERRRNEKKMRK